MDNILYLLCIMTLLVISIQDFAQRLIWWFLFPLAGLSILMLKILHSPASSMLQHTAINFSISGILILLVILYIRFRSHGGKNSPDGFGLGDGLMFIIASMLFPPVNYLIFLLVSFVASLFYGLLVPLMFRKIEKTVPLAGVMSLFMAIILFMNKVTPGVLPPEGELFEIYNGGIQWL